jgi:hypothetical protein
MPYILCPSCHRSMLASEYFQCYDSDCAHFAQCPACDACFPLPCPDHALQSVENNQQHAAAQQRVVEHSFVGDAK